ncbi:Processing alpha glucosidase I [Recurvomyces mirabilis]|uniref:Mannosyl-oligosaccharide glucosidase n=1 Tax=Recurvomyces mirabilis TaxID=574656 RepID=A0AAE1BYN2_9PEZI|nr:Processing alpha glucosidase I [Recurvomyces mirabilis]KAK5155561.1 Processing alpha glucosidase I [Recurvomyces mirabilis]
MPWKQWAVSLLLSTTVLAQDSTVFSKESNDTLLWGAYRPNVYFGVRPRLPKSLTTGLLWSRVEDFQSVQQNVRYTCEQHEGMAGYGWDAYDPRTGGVQTIHDRGNGIDIETSFVKFDGGGGGWSARIKGTPREDAEAGPGSEGGVESMKTAVWFTAGMEGLGGLEVEGVEEADDTGFEGDIVLNGQTSDLGEFKLTLTDNPANRHPAHNHPSGKSKPLSNSFVHSLQVPEEAMWQSKAILFGSLKTTIDAYVEEYTEEKMPPPWQTYTIQNRPGQGNMHVVQKVFQGAFEFDVFYAPAETKQPTSQDLTKAIKDVVDIFDKKYRSVLAPQAPFTAEKYMRFSKSLFSNLIGGIGYFNGDQLIDRSYDPSYEEENEGFHQETAEARSLNRQELEGPYELFTSIPSRPFFPRGFLWDEGFHLLPIVDWDPELVMQIISSWFGTMDEEGWIAREQILGAEARSKVPQEFQVQYPHYANPPTLFMTIQALIDHAQETSKDDSAKTLKPWLKQLYPLLQRNFAWYRRTQSGDLKSYDRPKSFSSKEAYRWRGRTDRHVLTSGLDDYPRAQPPHPGELHTDLMAWMGMMARSMQSVATYIGETGDSGTHAKIAEAIQRNTDDLHWDKSAKTYCDVTIDEYEESVRVCHKGYISIFPFMTGLVGPSNEHLGDVLDLIADKEELWSEHGVRSLSKKDELYGTEENYWRSPVWMNMNYLILTNLYKTAQSSGPHQAKATRMYNTLRFNLVKTVYLSWLETGFAWEQYHPETGQGQRTQHFTGWTSLVVKMMEMPDLGSGKGKGGHEEL